MKRTIAGGLIGVWLWAAGLAPQALAQSTQELAEQLNNEAMEAYHQMDVDRAAELLERALELGTSGKVTHNVLAETHRNLAVVYIGAMDDVQAGKTQLLEGLCTDPELQLDPLTSTPQIQAAFAEVQDEVDQGACPQAAPAASSVSSGPLGDAETAAPETYTQPTPPTNPRLYVDNETPWESRDPNQGKPTPFFFQLGLAMGLSWIDNGMPADRPAPSNQVFADDFNGTARYVEDPVETYLASQRDESIVPRFRLPDPNNFPELLGDWMPDADSEDYLLQDAATNTPQPYGGSCPADGTPTGPQVADSVTGANLLPSKYCVRVKNPGFVPGFALRAAFGYFVTPKASVAAIARFQFEAGKGDLAHVLLGGRGEYVILQPQSARGLMLSVFGGATIGQIQTSVSKSSSGPWATAGLFAAHVGTALRYRFHRHLGAFIAPEFDLFFPDVLAHIDIPAGVEVTF